MMVVDRDKKKISSGNTKACKYLGEVVYKRGVVRLRCSIGKYCPLKGTARRFCNRQKEYIKDVKDKK